MSQLSFDALSAFGWTDRVLAHFNELAEPDLLPARVVRVERSVCFAVGVGGTEEMLSALRLPAVGDWVAVDDGVVRHVLSRSSTIARGDPSGDAIQVLAANVDLVFITAPADHLSEARVEREIAIGWDSGAQPVVVLTKADLGAKGVVDELARRLLGTDVVAVSAVTGQGLEELRGRLRPCKTAVLFGPSGAGKSTLANALLGSDVLATGEVRAGDRRGRHTTTSRQLVAVPGGGVLIDTPGLRGLALACEVDLDAVFPEIETLARLCRFADCRHEVEPDCAVVDAVARGALDPERLASFRKLEREAAFERRRVDPLARQEAGRRWKALAKAAKSHDKRRPIR